MGLIERLADVLRLRRWLLVTKISTTTTGCGSTHALMAGKADVLGEDRLCQEDRGKALAAHSTLNRLELGAVSGDTHCKKIIARPEEIEALLIKEGVKAIARKSREVILDLMPLMTRCMAIRKELSSTLRP